MGQPRVRFAVIGGEAAGTAVVGALIRRTGRTPLDVTVFEERLPAGPGNAFGPDTPAALVNQQARHMSIRGDQPGHLLSWPTVRPDTHARMRARPGGVRATGLNQVVDAAGIPARGLYALGQITAAEFYLTSSVPVIVRRVDLAVGAALAALLDSRPGVEGPTEGLEVHTCAYN